MTARSTGTRGRKAGRRKKASTARGKAAVKPARKPVAKKRKPAASKASASRTAKKRTSQPGPRRAAARTRIAATRAADVGAVRHAYPRAGVVVLALEGSVREGDWVAVRGATTDLVARVTGVRRGDRRVKEGGPGETVTLAIGQRARRGDRVERLDR